MSIVSMMPSNRLILYHSLLLLLSIFPSIRVFSSESALRIRWPDAPKHWSFSFSISPSNEYSGLIFFRTDHLISLPSKGLWRVFSSIHSLKASVLQCSVFFMVQLSPDFPGGSDGKASVYNAGDPASIPGLGRSPWEGNGNLLQYYCLVNPMDRGAW